MITFTLSPTLFPDITEQLITSVETYIIAQATRALSIKHYAYVREHHKNGRPHWHVSIVTRKCLKKDRFHYYQRKYGNIDFSRSKSTNHLEALEYMSKEANPVILM